MNIEDLRKLCMSHKGVTEDVKWGNDLVFSVLGKMFCAAGLEKPLKIGFKVTDDEFEEMSQREGIIPAPYMARNKWVLVNQANKLSAKEWKHYIAQSYELVKAKLSKKALKDAGIS